MDDAAPSPTPRRRLSRRAVIAGSVVIAAGVAVPITASAIAAGNTPSLGAADPLVRQRADPHIARDSAGRYYFTGSVPEYDRIVLRSADTLGGLTDASERVLWTRPETGELGGYIWAPELHEIDDRWYIYFAAGDADEPFHIRPYVLEADGPDPMAAEWTVSGRIVTGFDSFSLDATTFEHRGRRYLVWAQAEPGLDTSSNLYISEMADASTLVGVQTRIAVPTAEWETRGFAVNEGPYAIIRNDRVFITFSASATDANYCVGLLTADADADLLDAASWTKSDGPVMVSDASADRFGPGHNCFTTARAENGDDVDVLVYHARDYEAIEGDPLFDPNRHAHVQVLGWDADGTPDFGGSPRST